MKLLLLSAAVSLALFPAVPAAAQGADGPVDLGNYAGPLRFEAADGGVLELGDGRRFTGVLEARLSSSGELVLVNDVDMQTYVEGIAEMPARWPMEALKAQAVAARTYAWWQSTRDAFDGYDICSTTACQVYRGREVVETPEVGQRWAQAVAETEGEVLLYENEPILARYFSTSGGHTFNNEDVFASSGAFPYLVGVPDPDDAVSPLHTWQATFTREQFDAIALRGATLPAVVPVADIERIKQPDPTPDRIIVTGDNGETVDITAGELRNFLNTAAPNAFPDLFPGLRNNGIQRLPATVPSGRYEIEVTDEQVILHGSGWGHGVGMGQYGAKGKAERGLGHEEILAAYYNGLEPTSSADVPKRIRVGLSGIGSALTITSTSVFTISAGDQVLIDRGLGSFVVEEVADRTLRLQAPPGFGAPLVLSTLTASRTQPFAVEQVALDIVTNKPVELVLTATPGEAGEPVDVPLGVAEPGRQSLAWGLEGVDGSPVAPGPWTVEIVAIDESGRRQRSTTQLEILDPRAREAAVTVLPVIVESDESSLPMLLGVLAAGTLGGLATGWVLRRLDRRARP